MIGPEPVSVLEMSGSKKVKEEPYLRRDVHVEMGGVTCAIAWATTTPLQVDRIREKNNEATRVYVGLRHSGSEEKVGDDGLCRLEWWGVAKLRRSL